MYKSMVSAVNCLQLAEISIYYPRTLGGTGQRLEINNVSVELLEDHPPTGVEYDTLYFTLSSADDKVETVGVVRVQWGRIAGDQQKTMSYLSKKEMVEIGTYLAQSFGAQFYLRRLDVRVSSFQLQETFPDGDGYRYEIERHSVPYSVWETILRKQIGLLADGGAQLTPPKNETYTIAREGVDELAKRFF